MQRVRDKRDKSYNKKENNGQEERRSDKGYNGTCHSDAEDRCNATLMKVMRQILTALSLLSVTVTVKNNKTCLV